MVRPLPIAKPAHSAWPCRLAGLVAAGITLLAPAAGQEVELRWDVPQGDIYAGQTFPLTLEVTATTSGGGGFVQLFPQPLELPIQIEAFGAISHLSLAPRVDGGETAVVLDGQVRRAEREPSEPGVTVLRFTHLAWARRSGSIRLPEIAGQYATTSGFREDLVRGQVPLDRQERTSRGPSRSINVLPLPETDQPIDFEGAVGPMTMEASVRPNRAVVGETIQLVVTLVGGSLNEDQAEPRLEPLEGLRLVGTRSEELREDARLGRAFRFDLEVTSSTPTRTPAATLTVFDPESEPPSYTRIRSDPVPIAIRSLPADRAAQADMETVPAPGEADLRASTESREEPRLIWTPAVAAFIALLALVSALRKRRERGGGPP